MRTNLPKTLPSSASVAKKSAHHGHKTADDVGDVQRCQVMLDQATIQYAESVGVNRSHGLREAVRRARLWDEHIASTDA